MSPHTHEASRKLGLTKFAFRYCKDNGKDSAWCTTYKAPDHFNDYYYERELTFYYIRIYSPDIFKKIKKAFGVYHKYSVVAITVSMDGQMEGWDGEDEKLSSEELKKYTQIIGFE